MSLPTSPLPDPRIEIRLTALHATRGANYWSREPVTRMDLVVGAYEEISSAQVPGLTRALVAALPGLVEHRCSIGERGGFITRLRWGTYAPHIVEHVALELQTMIGHDVGYGRTRGGDVHGEYTLVFEHLHEAVGLRAAALALETVQRAFAGTLDTVDHAVAELRALAALPAPTVVRPSVLCGITGGALRAEAREELARRGIGDAEDELVIDVAPAYILQAGLPYSRSALAIVLDAEPMDVPPRYQASDRAQRLVSVVADAVGREGIVIAPAKEWEVQDRARDAGCRVAVFATDADVTVRDKHVARAAAWVDHGTIVVEHGDERIARGAVRDGVPLAPQVVAELAAFSIEALRPSRERRAPAARNGGG